MWIRYCKEAKEGKEEKEASDFENDKSQEHNEDEELEQNMQSKEKEDHEYLRFWPNSRMWWRNTSIRSIRERRDTKNFADADRVPEKNEYI